MNVKKLPPLLPDRDHLKKRLDKFKSNLEEEFNKKFLDLANQFSTVQGIESYMNQSLESYVFPEVSRVAQMMDWLDNQRVFSKPLKYAYETFKGLVLVGSLGYTLYDNSLNSLLLTTLITGAYIADTVYFPVLTPESKEEKLDALSWYEGQLTSMRVQIDNVHLPLVMADLSVPTVSGPQVRIVFDNFRNL